MHRTPHHSQPPSMVALWRPGGHAAPIFPYGDCMPSGRTTPWALWSLLGPLVHDCCFLSSGSAVGSQVLPSRHGFGWPGGSRDWACPWRCSSRGGSWLLCGRGAHTPDWRVWWAWPGFFPPHERPACGLLGGSLPGLADRFQVWATATHPPLPRKGLEKRFIFHEKAQVWG